MFCQNILKILIFDDRYIETHVCKRLPVNWKAAEEAFMEAYHVKETHAGGAEFSEPVTTYDVFPEKR